MFSRLDDAVSTPAAENWLSMSSALFAAPIPPLVAIRLILLPKISVPGKLGSPLVSYFVEASSRIDSAARRVTSPKLDWMWLTFRFRSVCEIQMLPCASAVTDPSGAIVPVYGRA